MVGLHGMSHNPHTLQVADCVVLKYIFINSVILGHINFTIKIIKLK